MTSSAPVYRALDALEIGIIVLSQQLDVLYSNEKARELVGDAMPRAIADAVDGYVFARRSGRLPPAVRAELNGRQLYVRVVQSAGTPPLEVAQIREEVLRDADRFRTLNGRYGITRREFQVLNALALGKTNRFIAEQFGLSEGTVARHVHRLLERFEAPNRTRLVNMVERALQRRA